MNNTKSVSSLVDTAILEIKARAKALEAKKKLKNSKNGETSDQINH